MFDLTPFGRGGRGLDGFREVDDFEKRFLGKPLPTFRTDIRESEEAFLLEAELPGFTKEEVRAFLQNDRLTITAEQKREADSYDALTGYIQKERMRGTLSRSFDVTGIRSDGIYASLENGILTLILPKADPKKNIPKELEIR